MSRARIIRLSLSVVIGVALVTVLAVAKWFDLRLFRTRHAVDFREVPAHGSDGEREDVTDHPPFIAVTDARRAFLLAESKRIELGDARDRVVRLLGNPTDEAQLVEKGQPPQLRVCVLTYYLTKWERDLVNEKMDEYIKIFQDVPHRRVMRIEIRVRSGKTKGEGAADKGS